MKIFKCFIIFSIGLVSVATLYLTLSVCPLQGEHNRKAEEDILAGIDNKFVKEKSLKIDVSISLDWSVKKAHGFAQKNTYV